MPQKILKFTGINRNVSEFNSIGACEELINIRPTANGLKIVKDKNILVVNANRYKFLVEHQFGATQNFIAATNSDVKWVSLSGEEKMTLLTGSAEEITTAGNVVLIKCSDGSQPVFKFENGTYKEFNMTIPAISLSVELNDFSASVKYESATVTKTIGEAKELLANGFSKFYNEYPHGLAGPIVIGCTFELEDGNELWSSGFAIIDPTKDSRCASSGGSSSVTNTGLSVTVYGAKEAKLSFDIDNYSSVSGVKNIKFYSSIPLCPYDMEETPSGDIYPKKLTNTEINLAGQNMYLQKEVTFRKADNFILNTSYETASNDLMPVTSGTIYRKGSTVSYNNRFHFYDSKTFHTIQKPSFGVHSNRQLPAESTYVDIRKAKLYVEIDNGEETLYVATPSTFDVQVNAVMDFVYPMGGIKRGYLKTSDDNFVTNTWYSIPFSDSDAYNYSCALDYVLLSPCDAPVLNNVIEAHGQSIMFKEEPNAINVSAPFNPYVFPVNYSYGVGGKVLDLATSYLPISSTQVGQYPITVFTTAGIYALEQGSGNVLYGNVVPLQPHVISGKAKATPQGTFYVSSNQLYLISGRDSRCVSLPLDGGIELSLRGIEAYEALCNHCKLSELLSGIEFKKFIQGASLAYDQLHNELHISNPVRNNKYSYVLNLDTAAYHKVDGWLQQDKSSSRYALKGSGNGGASVVDLHVENDGAQPILLQSRPMSLEALYTHIQRLIMLVDADLQSERHLFLSVFASDNLNDWKCIISAQKAGVSLRHIRTNKAAKSYKDYIILITGRVGTDTDISDIIADYTIVNRRLG